jgi:hypothetical protein
VKRRVSWRKAKAQIGALAPRKKKEFNMIIRVINYIVKVKLVLVLN